jgi:RimJ/RimL family protein N-acetyltransferase
MIDFKYGIALGPIDRAQKDRMRAWRNDPRIWIWCRQNDLISDMDQDRWMEHQSLDPSIRMYSVMAPTPAAGELSFCGVAGLTSIDPGNRRAEFSLYIAPQMHQKGLGRKALQTLLAHGFLNLGLHVIWGESFADNPAMKLFRGLGFREEGIRKDFYFKQGRFIDAHLISMTEDEWRKRYFSASPRSSVR